MKTTTKYKPNIEIVADPETLAQRSVELFIADAQKAIRAKNAFYVAISGGHTPKRFFELLSDAPQANSLPWDRVQLFWVDERIVGADSQWSNYKLFQGCRSPLRKHHSRCFRPGSRADS
jgi:6-phosphogluconolactonase